MKNKKIIVIGLIIIEIISCFLMYKSSQNKITKLADVKLKENNKDGMFAIQYETNGGIYENTNLIPKGNYELNINETQCMNHNGDLLNVEEILSYDNTTGSITIEGNKTSYCYLVFDIRKPDTINNIAKTCDMGNSITVSVDAKNASKYYYSINDGEYIESVSNNHVFKNLNGGEAYKVSIYTEDSTGLKSKVKSLNVTTLSTKITGADLINTRTINEYLSNDILGGMYRYQGTDSVNNWIYFGLDECQEDMTSKEVVDKYAYRIIGITPVDAEGKGGEIKLIKETVVREETTTGFQWHNKETESDCGTEAQGAINCTWEKSRIFNRLNGYCGTNNDLSKADNKCTGVASGSRGDSNIFIGNSYYEYLQNTTWLNKIDEVEWKYGDTRSDGSYNGDAIYAIENAFTEEITAKIGLQYIHDYYYAYKTSEEDAGKPETNSNARKSWIHFRKSGYNLNYYEFFQTRFKYSTGPSSYLWRARYVDENGVVGTSSISNNIFSARPVFYLKNTIQIDGGSGSKINPYIVKE